MAGGSMDMFMTKNVAVENEYGLKSSLRKGMQSDDISQKFVHPLQNKPDKIWSKEQSYKMLRNIQGIHAPLKLEMELLSVNKAITRLPCLPSSNFSRDILKGEDADIMPKDFLGDRYNSEVMGNPHLMMEHKLGLKPL